MRPAGVVRQLSRWSRRKGNNPPNPISPFNFQQARGSHPPNVLLFARVGLNRKRRGERIPACVRWFFLLFSLGSLMLTQALQGISFWVKSASSATAVIWFRSVFTLPAAPIRLFTAVPVSRGFSQRCFHPAALVCFLKNDSIPPLTSV